MLSQFLPQSKPFEGPSKWKLQLLSQLGVCLQNCQDYLQADELPGLGALHGPGNKIAHFYHKEGYKSPASQIYSRCLSWREKDYPGTDEATLSLIIHLSTAYHRSVPKEFDATVKLADRALAASKLLPPEHMLRGLTLVRVARVRREQGSLTIAIENLEEGMAILKKSLGVEHHAMLSNFYRLDSKFFHYELIDHFHTILGLLPSAGIEWCCG
ncbi:uncharacterized protein BDZ99DRAFT_104613 [Mytilinidion resinicola]|uniref:TPR-like protein n=1 Tax=Mytilinidion resinicola TaxID=574789 RepID=A0A6A6YDR1_9PEZI|nr:uncharacterized protein BDZ99DRAFT_104613 [Mytilinidion resinicola]KAF2806134.1 hypothetical protein BDZ99DRAFT_104613 [Mytilinidion resinicola]